MISRIVLLSLLTLTSVAVSEEPVKIEPAAAMLEKSVVLDLPFGNDNPRNSEGAFITLADGRIMFVYTRYSGGSDSDHAPAELAARFSKDHGKTWSKEDLVLIRNEGKQNVMSVSLLRLKNNEIAMFYLRKNSSTDCRPYVRFSKDEGKSWSDPVLCTPDEIGYYVLNNDRVLLCDDGTLILPVALHQNRDGKFVAGADIFVYISRDHGRTWHRQMQVPNPNNTVLQEPGLVELADGRILMYIRSNAGCQCYSFSADDGKNWTPIVSSPLVAPMSPAILKRIPGSTKILAIWNPSKTRRNPMNIAVLSPDAGSILLEKTLDFSEDDSHWFCYPALYFLGNNQFLVGYCAGERRIVGLNATRIILSSLHGFTQTVND